MGGKYMSNSGTRKVRMSRSTFSGWQGVRSAGSLQII